MGGRHARERQHDLLPLEPVSSPIPHSPGASAVLALRLTLERPRTPSGRWLCRLDAGSCPNGWPAADSLPASWNPPSTDMSGIHAVDHHRVLSTSFLASSPCKYIATQMHASHFQALLPCTRRVHTCLQPYLGASSRSIQAHDSLTPPHILILLILALASGSLYSPSTRTRRLYEHLTPRMQLARAPHPEIRIYFMSARMATV